MTEKKKKIGILTFHCSNNYGAVLQAFALCRTLQTLYPQFDVDVIDYRCKSTITPTLFSDLRKKKGFLGALLHYKQINRMNDKFNLFRKKHLHLTKPYYSTDELKSEMDDYVAIVSGSDQVWNLKWSNDDTVYFQDFHNNNEKKLSYAASFGFTEIEQHKVKYYQEVLSKFKYISLREQSGIVLVDKQLGLKSVQHLDPTLLLDHLEWNDIAKEPSINGKYILVYMVPKQKSVIGYALKLKKETGLPIVMLSKNLKPLNVIHRGSASPEEFVGLFKNAEYIVTNSFHGTAFACIYCKNAWIDLKNDRGFNTRSQNLLELCGLTEMIDENGIAIIQADSWKIATNELSKKREISFDYLRYMLEGCDWNEI